MEYAKMSKEQLSELLSEQYVTFNRYKNLELSYDLTRGKPCRDQLDLSNDMVSRKYLKGFNSISNQEVRNYGVLDGIPEAKQLMAEMMGVGTDEIVVCGNSSLNLMYDMLVRFMLFGTGGNGSSGGSEPWTKQGKIKWLCPVPGYDRHFLVTEKLGFEMINVPLTGDGPDMDLVEELVKDPAVKGMWMVPKYSNPTGEVFSDAKIRRLAAMKTAAPDFRIMCDDAYTVHFLGDAPAKQLNLLDACKEAGNPERVFLFGSTSKITFPGSGISAVCGSIANIKYLLSYLTVQTIGYDKINQLRHARFLKDYKGIIAHMKRHAEILRPKFAAVDKILTNELEGLGILTWTHPDGGYFISIDTLPGCASAVVAKAKECGVKFTPAGSTYPRKNDPEDRNIRIAPTLPPPEELEAAIKILCVCVKICSIEKLLAE
ncbi:MAG: aminotransferase class I/II-fold pyridoxal phosphate-dependent enzyme [Clostridia bacterium]|nr:aminotransferase class I/II-fold pyridoxal phosphate-dependent enzyme [Clostridia bacterium]